MTVIKLLEMKPPPTKKYFLEFKIKSGYKQKSKLLNKTYFGLTIEKTNRLIKRRIQKPQMLYLIHVR